MLLLCYVAAWFVRDCCCCTAKENSFQQRELTKRQMKRRGRNADNKNKTNNTPNKLLQTCHFHTPPPRGRGRKERRERETAGTWGKRGVFAPGFILSSAAATRSVLCSAPFSRFLSVLSSVCPLIASPLCLGFLICCCCCCCCRCLGPYCRIACSRLTALFLPHLLLLLRCCC